MKYSIHQVAEIISAEAEVTYPSEISDLLTDSRSLSDPAGTLFFALETKRNDGHKYIPDLYKLGVRNFVIHHAHLNSNQLPGCNLLQVENTLTALQQLAAFHRSQFRLPVVGITGSNGKTIVKEWLYQLLHTDYCIVRSPRSYNSQLGVPLSVWELDEQAELGIFEAGISMPGEMGRLASIIKPTIGLLTNIGDAHQEHFSSLREKCLEKLNLFRDCELLVYEKDPELISECIEASGLKCRLFSWSKKDPEADLYIRSVEVKDNTTIIQYVSGKRNNRIVIPFVDNASCENAIHCLALVLYLSPGITGLSHRFESLESVAMRLDVKKGINNCILINDTYNSDINSLDIALDFMSRRSLDKKMKSVVILSDVLQSGVRPDLFYRQVATLLDIKQVQHLIGIGGSISAHADKFGQEKAFFQTTEAFLQSGYLHNLRDAMILLKGSRSFRFELISEQLEEKVHETVLEVDLDAVVHNFNYFRSLLNPRTKMVCMVKAFGYGVGSYELAKTLQDQGCDYLAVALADEGVELRREGITMPIMVMNPEMTSFNLLLEYNLEPEIYNFRILDALLKETKRRGIIHYPVHIKLDTGMHRLGFGPEDVDRLAEKLNFGQSLKVRSVFSHLAGSDNQGFDDFTRLQVTRFKYSSEKLEAALGYPVMKHVLNSAGIERFPEYQFDMVRLGIGLYGISVSDSRLLKPVATLKTTLLQVKDVEAGETVGYNRNGKIMRNSRIACLPIGYADGLDRRLGNGRGSVSINGSICPFVGNICMDICMVDVTDIQASEGDTAIIFGKEIPIETLASGLDTIPYEILTSVSPRVKRVYFRE